MNVDPSGYFSLAEISVSSAIDKILDSQVYANYDEKSLKCGKCYKYQNSIVSENGLRSTIHFVFNSLLGLFDDFKFK